MSYLTFLLNWIADRTIVGTDENDRGYDGDIFGTDETDFIFGLKGHDRLYGQDGNDGLYGGEGNDVLDGGAGDDYIDGGDGADILRGGDGEDTFVVSNGDRIMDFNVDDDTLKFDFSDPGTIQADFDYASEDAVLADATVTVGDVEFVIEDINPVDFGTIDFDFA